MLQDKGTDNKLVILFVLDKFEMPLSEDLLLEICSIENLWMPYMLCQTSMYELIKSGFITAVSSDNPGKPLYTLTTDGRTCLSYFYNDIPLSRREDITEYVKTKRINYRKKQEFTADYEQNKDGSYTVNLKVLGVAQTMMDIKFVVGERSLATSICNSWGDKAPYAYQALCDILIEN